MRTPWGESEKLRRRRLPPGPHPDGATAVEAHQRERLFAAMIAGVAEHGYERTSIDDVAHRAGVARRTAYELFPHAPKRECFLAAVDELYRDGFDRVGVAYRQDGEWEARLRAALTALLELIAEQPAAAHACIVDIYEAGQPGSARVEVGLARFDGFLRESFAECPRRTTLPEELVESIVGALHMVIHDRLREGRATELPDMAGDMLAWVLSYEAPGRPLRGGTVAATPPAEHSRAPAERLMLAIADAVAEHGYQEVRLADLAARAQTSLATLYENFGGKEGLFLAAFDALTGRALEVSEEAFARRPDWSEAMRTVNRELFSYLASEPALTRLALVEVLGAGRAALTARDLMLKPFAERLMRGGYESAPEAPEIAAEACALAVYTAAGHWIRREGAESLPAVVPLATFIELTPFLGARAAARIAAEDACVDENAGAPGGPAAPTPGRG